MILGSRVLAAVFSTNQLFLLNKTRCTRSAGAQQSGPVTVQQYYVS